jgi:hypothetical protein
MAIISIALARRCAATRTAPNAGVSPRSVVRRPRERPPRTVVRLVPVPRLISVARPVKVSVVTPSIIARTIGTRHGSRRHARFLALRLRSRRGIGRYCIVKRLSRERLLYCGSLGERGSTGRRLRCRGRGKLAWLQTGRRPGCRRGWTFFVRRNFRLPQAICPAAVQSAVALRPTCWLSLAA